MTITVGDRLPGATLVKVTADDLDQVAADEYFRGHRVALFAVPGAFTPTCSNNHLPGFVEHAQALKAKGIDEIACTAVNDPFVLRAWAKANDAGAITMLADGNGSFADALGLSFDGTGLGMGKRSRRYAMIVADGVVEQLHVEEAGEFKVSAATYLLDRI